ncbi:MAG: hypothetical protein D6797_09440 [Bdellovibrio sp.]|nr:MAG: hypothetical protein D6797_09440 [Bdellovibrio sp.]
MRDLFLFLFLEVLAAINAAVSFSYLATHGRLLSIFVASSGFLLVGAVIIYKTWKNPRKFKMASFWMGHVHMWVTSVPMVVHRLLDLNFTSESILGVPVSQFHAFAQYVYYGLMVATVFDISVEVLRKKK